MVSVSKKIFVIIILMKKDIHMLEKVQDPFNCG